MQSLKINTSKIDKTALYQGKDTKYLDLVLFDNKDGLDQYGNAGFIVQELPKSRRDSGERGPIVGNWKHIVKKGDAAPAAPAPMSKAGLAQTSLNPADSGDDVPF